MLGGCFLFRRPPGWLRRSEPGRGSGMVMAHFVESFWVGTLVALGAAPAERAGLSRALGRLPREPASQPAGGRATARRAEPPVSSSPRLLSRGWGLPLWLLLGRHGGHGESRGEGVPAGDGAGGRPPSPGGDGRGPLAGTAVRLLAGAPPLLGGEQPGHLLGRLRHRRFTLRPSGLARASKAPRPEWRLLALWRRVGGVVCLASPAPLGGQTLETGVSSSLAAELAPLRPSPHASLAECCGIFLRASGIPKDSLAVKWTPLFLYL